MKIGIGIDIGGTGIKGALVNLKKGSLLGERIRFDTPDGATPREVISKVVQIVNELDGPKEAAVGICFPAVIKRGFTLSAANVDNSWIGLNALKEFENAFQRDVLLLNDADAAGVAEIRFGAGKKKRGLIAMITLGTGIGSALFMNGKLIPNSELGHLEIDGQDYESKASFAAKERENLSFEQWASRLTKYFRQLERLLSPDLIIIGGGVSKQHELFLPMIDCNTPLMPAETKNNAGIIGAAYLASKKKK